MDAATRNSLIAAGQQFFDCTAKGDVATMRQNAIPSLASDFGGIEAAIEGERSKSCGAQAKYGSLFLLKAEGRPPSRGPNFCAVCFGRNGSDGEQCSLRVPNLPPGEYGVVILDVAGKRHPLFRSYCRR